MLTYGSLSKSSQESRSIFYISEEYSECFFFYTYTFFTLSALNGANC